MPSVSAKEIANVMALMPLPKNWIELDERVREGLPKSALLITVEHVSVIPEERRILLYSIVAEATFKRRRTKLTPDESGKTERLARVFATAQYVLNSETKAQEFLNIPHALLEGQTPLSVAMTELGARRVETLLWEAFYGLPI